MELSRILRTILRPWPSSLASNPKNGCPSLHNLCLRTAAIYATTALYQFHERRTENADDANEHAMWEEVFPLLEQNFFQLVPPQLYELFLDYVLSALEVAVHFDESGKELMHYIALFFPRTMKRFRAQRYTDRVLMPTINTIQRCAHIEELYLEKADSAAVTTYLLAHILKFTNNLRVLALPKQSDDDVASIIGINCPKLESVVLTGTGITNNGLSWFVCCKNLHTVIMPGFCQGITPKGVALLLNGLEGLKHVIYDAMSDVLTFIDFNTSQAHLPKFGLKTVLFHPMELLSSNHLELVTKLCPDVEWLSLDSALFYNLEGLGRLSRLSLLRLNYKGRPMDQTVVDFFSINAHNLTTLQLFEIKDMTFEELSLTIGQCLSLENLCLVECSFNMESGSGQIQPSISKSIANLQMINVHFEPDQFVQFAALFENLVSIEVDRFDLDVEQTKLLLLTLPSLRTLRCPRWGNNAAKTLAQLQLDVRNGLSEVFVVRRERTMTMAATLLSEYAAISPILTQ